MIIYCKHCGVRFEQGTSATIELCPSCNPVGKPFLSFGTYPGPIPESELSTWKTRAEKNEQLLGHANALIEAQAKHITEVEAERDTLKARCEKLEEELAHEREYSASKGDHS
jgi:hypothetical protein